MRNLTPLLAILIIVSGCADKTEPTVAVTAPITTNTAADKELNGPPPPPDAVIANAADAELEAAIRATAPDYHQQSVGEGDAGKTRYAAARIDLNGDGQNEVFVYLMGPYFCGTGGCNLLVFSQGMDGYSLLASIPTSEPLVIRAYTQNEGYSDFWRMQSGGGKPAEYVQHQFKGGKYFETSRTSTDRMPDGSVIMDETSALANALNLEPRNQ